MPTTPDVLNQPGPLQDYDVFASDPALVEAVDREVGPDAVDGLGELGRRAGSAEAFEWGRLANANPPVLRTHDRFGNRIDEVEYHPAYHQLMTVAVEHGLHASPWSQPEGSGAHVTRAAGFSLWSQVEAGHGCPISMTYAVVPALRTQGELAAVWEPRLTTRDYEGRSRPASDKLGALAGMAMTEKQGGSDVRANITTAVPVDGGGPGGEYLLTGHKWFCSAPMGDLFLMLAQAPGGLSCFAVPRWLPDGTRNPIAIQRLKDKLGNRSNASAEIEFDNVWGQSVGEEGRGVPTIISMVNHTRLDCVIGATAGMRQALSQAIHHCSHRSAFGRRLVEHPLMANVLADLAIEAEAATATMIRLAAAYDRGDDDHDAPLRRIATAASKYWICKRQPTFVAEALECVGGNGYIEESMLPRLFRESPLNGIWEGSGNVMCLDVLRAMLRTPSSVEAFRVEVDSASGGDARLDSAVARIKADLSDLDHLEHRARRVVEQMVLVLQGSLLVRYSPHAVADAFCASRLGDDWGHAFGTLPRGLDLDAIIARAAPAVA